MKITVERTPIAAARIAITTTRPTTSGTLSLVPVEPGTGVGVFVGSDVGVGGIVGVGVFVGVAVGAFSSAFVGSGVGVSGTGVGVST